MKIRLAILALAAMAVTPSLRAQSTGAAAAPASVTTKVGVINIQAAITGTGEGRQAAQELQSQFAPRQTELDNLRKQGEDLQVRVRTTSNTLSDEEKARLAREAEQLQRTYQRKMQDTQDDFNEAQQEVINRIGRKMMDILDKYARDNGYSLILDTSSQQTPVIFAAPATDVTQDIIRLYDQAHPVKNAPAKSSSAPAPKPAAPAAAPPKPATPPGQQAPKQ
jgi:outer membrane protein